MSGPKSIIVVTREEVEAICRRHLTQLDDMIARIRAFAERHHRLDRKLEEDLERRRQQLQGLFAKEQFVALQKHAPAAVVFLEDQLDAMRDGVVKARLHARERRRRLGDAARSLVIVFRTQNRALPADIEAIVRHCHDVNESELAGFEKRIEAVVRELGSAAAGAVGDAALASRLAQGTARITFEEWLAMQPATAADQRLERLLAELDVLDDPEEAAPLLARAAAIREEPDGARRALLTDSLTVELASRAEQRRQRETARGLLQEASAALASIDTPATRRMTEPVERELVLLRIEPARALAQKAMALVEKEMQERGAATRRKAMLEGLAALGYEVREGMATAWVADGRLVLRKPGSSDYGIEVAASPDAARIQARVVRSASTAHDPARDFEMETVWCSEFDRLRQRLAERGGEARIEKARRPGEVPLKVVDMPRAGADLPAEEQDRALRQRSFM